MELTTTTPSKQVVGLTDFPHEILLQIFSYVVWMTPSAKQKRKDAEGTSGQIPSFFPSAEDILYVDPSNDHNRYLDILASLRASKHICSVVEEAYFTQRRFSLNLLGGLPTPFRHPSISRRVHSPYSDDDESPVLLSAFTHSTFADRDLYYDNVIQLDIGILPTIRTDALTLAHLITPVLDRCQEVASIDVGIVKSTAEWLKLGDAGGKEDEAVKMIKSMVDRYAKRVNKAVRLRLRWL
ncbi:hypothetical protein LTR56_005371 [Elasticomyces elasticus]|nr:hypothetical protein LTR56_005371 [Elasticomyces elasticus]KAK5761431.1 hypothetical protein LTS12_008391 [Elasticomyces elasticus]